MTIIHEEYYKTLLFPDLINIKYIKYIQYIMPYAVTTKRALS